ncbi:hypothetical protein N7517_010074 [Penicillium concentricum]|uniref:LPXTG-domain-containing protein n=1 Tax=Penicillium concentricum TaxID=293559 RepID=A0A9W9RNK0_9EURO|nr:uncharacterized protein N7517_010074 [Penicillium concentricum]KAJ5360883.1 hypothetical protein N7517_010074 [Penicillium concentricum]
MTSTIATLVARAAESTGTITMPMSSIFTAPASCSNSWTYEPEAANLVANGLLIQNAVDNDNADPACFPSGYSQYGRVRATVAYSPGYCPHGYTSADLLIHKPATTAVCCPSGFAYYEEKRDLQTTFAGCLSEFPSASSTIVTVRQAEEESTQVSGPVTMWAQAIQVQMQASDKSLFVSATTTTTESKTDSKTRTTSSDEASETAASSISSSTSSSTQTGLTVPTVPSVPDIPEPATPSPAAPGTGTEASGLSTGAKIGVGVGVGAAGLIVLVALLFWFFRRRQQKGQKPLPDTTSSYGSHPEISELGGSTQTDPNMVYQRPGHGVPSEFGGSSQAGASSIMANTRTTGPSELHATNPGPKFVHELGA